MTGKNQSEVCPERRVAARNHVIIENRHQPTTVHLKTYVNDRYKITVHYDRDYGEMFDLQTDPSEVTNLWNNPQHVDLKAELLLKLIHAEMGKEAIPMPRIAVA